MRQGQQNRRGRGRNRKGQSPLARNFESNGPDVKIRGTASHVAEKYMALARDAVASGDQVLAENYLQHAEHYNRIIMAAQPQFQPHDPMNGQRPRNNDGGQSGQSDSDQGYDGPDDDGDEQPSDSGFGSEAPRFMEQGRFSDQQPGDDRQPNEQRGPRERFSGGDQPRQHEGRNQGEHRGGRRRRRHDNGGRQNHPGQGGDNDGQPREANGSGGGQQPGPARASGSGDNEGTGD